MKINRNLCKTKILIMDPWQHFLRRALRKDRVLENSYDVTVT